MANLRSLTRKTFHRSASQWLAEVEDADALVARRVRPGETFTAREKLWTLTEIFPTVAFEVRRDVLAAADFRVDVAAAMLSDVVREEARRGGASVQPALCFHELHGEEALEHDVDEEDWSEVISVSGTSCASTGAEREQWVMIQDEWEVLDQAGDRVRSFAEVLRSGAAEAAEAPEAAVPAPRLPKLSVKEQAPVKLVSLTKRREEDREATDVERLCVKSFNVRRRHALKRHSHHSR